MVATWEDFVLVSVPTDEKDVFGCSELERWCTAAPALVVLVIPVFIGGVGIRDDRRARVAEGRAVGFDVDEELEEVDFNAVTELDLVIFDADDEVGLRSGLDGVGGGFWVSEGASDSSSCTGSSAFWVSSSS